MYWVSLGTGKNTSRPKMTGSCTYLPARGKLKFNHRNKMCRTVASRAILTDHPICRHRFWCPKSSTENLVFSVWLDRCNSNDHILDVNFLRNLSGYMDDCLTAGLKPSIFQIILFCENATSLLCPPFLNWMPVWLLIWVHCALAWFAECVLG